MTYRVIWRQHLIDQIAQTYLDMLDSEDVVSASRLAAAIPRVWEQLSRNPSDQGESREGYERVTFVGPITVTYEVVHDEMTVLVLKVVVRRSRN